MMVITNSLKEPRSPITIGSAWRGKSPDVYKNERGGCPAFQTIIAVKQFTYRYLLWVRFCVVCGVLRESVERQCSARGQVSGRWPFCVMRCSVISIGWIRGGGVSSTLVCVMQVT